MGFLLFREESSTPNFFTHAAPEFKEIVSRATFFSPSVSVDERHNKPALPLKHGATAPQDHTEQNSNTTTMLSKRRMPQELLDLPVVCLSTANFDLTIRDVVMKRNKKFVVLGKFLRLPISPHLFSTT